MLLVEELRYRIGNSFEKPWHYHGLMKLWFAGFVKIEMSIRRHLLWEGDLLSLRLPCHLTMDNHSRAAQVNLFEVDKFRLLCKLPAHSQNDE